MLFRFFPVSFPNVLILAGPFWREVARVRGEARPTSFPEDRWQRWTRCEVPSRAVFPGGGSGVTAFSGAEPVESKRVCVAAGAGGKSGGGLSWASLEGGISFAVSWSFSATVWFQVSLGFPALGGITAGTVRSFPFARFP